LTRGPPAYQGRRPGIVGKKYKGKTCAYCSSRTATTEDHVFSRKFFVEEDRADLPKAPACNRCNNIKSGYETYLCTVLPLGGRHPQAVANAEDVARRLAKNAKIARRLGGSTRPAWERDSTGLWRMTHVFDFDTTQLQGLLEFVGRGLAWHHWRLYLRPEDVAGSLFLTDTGNAFLQQWIGQHTEARRVEGDLGSGTVRYVGIQAAKPPELTVWSIRMYGGIVLSGSCRNDDGSVEPSTMWWAITGPPEMRGMLERFRQAQ